MKTMSLASQILDRHVELLKQHKIVFAGDIQDNYAAKYPFAKVLTSQYHHHNRLKQAQVESKFGVLFTKEDLKECSLLIYFWPKTKDEAIFQLTQLLSLCTQSIDILIVGENRIGVRSVENRFDSILNLQKIDTAKRCSLYYAKLNSTPEFDLETFWVSYLINSKVKHSALPGVFSRQHLDDGSALLIKSLQPTNPKTSENIHRAHPLNFLKKSQMSADVLDLCSGAGVIPLALHEHFPNLNWTLADAQAQALKSAEYNLSLVPVKAKVIASDLFSEIEGKFDMIISNPPFHDGKQTDYSLTETLIKNAPNFLRTEGALRIVANGFLPYEEIMHRVFKNVEVLEKNSKFTIYQSIKLGK